MSSASGDHDLLWHRTVPDLRDPILIAAFEGWNDAGDAATMAARQLAERFDATPLVDIDPERYFDFSTTRPIVRLDDDRQRSITWPENQLLAARVPAAAREEPPDDPDPRGGRASLLEL